MQPIAQRPPRPAKPRDYNLQSPTRGIVIPDSAVRAARGLTGMLSDGSIVKSNPKRLFQDSSATFPMSAPAPTPFTPNSRKALWPVPETRALEGNGSLALEGDGSRASRPRPPELDGSLPPEGDGSRASKRARIMTDELGEYIRLHSERFEKVEWSELVRSIRKRGDLLDHLTSTVLPTFTVVRKQS